jgi:2-dehydro-3-deoxyphosphogluconate aldolase/(4S)-4-hydroxy-2-oxoglutarate aldolase
MFEIPQQIGEYGIIPSVKILKPESALPLCRALESGGLPLVEVLFCAPGALEAIKLIRRQCPGILVLAGMIQTVEQAMKATSAGAQCILTSGFSRKVVEVNIGQGVATIPGASNPTDFEMAMEYDLRVVRLFPARQLGGLDYMRAASEPYPELQFVPMGGIDPEDVGGYAGFGKTLAVCCPWIAPEDFIAAGRFAEITRLAQEALRLVRK